MRISQPQISNGNATKMKISATLFVEIFLYALLAFFVYLMILITFQYIPINFAAAFLVTKEKEIQLPYYQIAFFTHVYTSIFVLIFGAFQFSKKLRKKFKKLHQNFGKAYVFLVLFFAAPSGLVMGYHGNGGISSQISFCLLGILWFYFTLKALLYIRKKNIHAHQNFMILSYALTLSAISLRLFKWIISNTLEFPPMDTYRVVRGLAGFSIWQLLFLLFKIKKEALRMSLFNI